jgi:hypothetical protein
MKMILLIILVLLTVINVALGLYWLAQPRPEAASYDTMPTTLTVEANYGWQHVDHVVLQPAGIK